MGNLRGRGQQETTSDGQLGSGVPWGSTRGRLGIALGVVLSSGVLSGCPTAVVTPPADPPQTSSQPPESVRDLVLGMQAILTPEAKPAVPSEAAKPVSEAAKSISDPQSSAARLANLSGLIATTYQVLSSRPLRGHRDAVNTAAFSPDGRSVVTASADVSVRVFDATTDTERQRLNGHAASVNSASYSPDGKRIVTASADHTVRLWAADTGRMQSVLNGHNGSVNAVVFSPDSFSSPPPDEQLTTKATMPKYRNDLMRFFICGNFFVILMSDKHRRDLKSRRMT